MILLQSLHNLPPMNMASLSFVYFYLPVSLLIYHLSPKAIRPAALLAISLGFYALAQPGGFWLVAASVLLDYAMIWGASTSGKVLWREVFFWSCIAKNAAMIVFFGAASRTGALALGLTVVCISGIDCALEVRREENPEPRGFMRVASYILFFPRLYAGPLSGYRDLCEGFDRAGFDWKGALIGFGRLAAGVLKYAGFGRALFWLYESVRLIPAEDASVLSTWILALSSMLSIYFTLSGLSDVARGAAGLFGLRLPQNFYYPYQSRSVSDFFERFNTTLGSFLKRAVLEPLGIRGSSTAAHALYLLFAGALWGMWFGVRANYIVWGILIAAFMIMEKYVYPSVLEALPTLFRRGYAFSALILSFAVPAGDTLTQSAEYLKLMMGVGADEIPLLNDRIKYILSANWMLLVISCFFATSITSLLSGFIRRSLPRASWVVLGAADAGALVLFTAITLGRGYV